MCRLSTGDETASAAKNRTKHARFTLRLKPDHFLLSFLSFLLLERFLTFQVSELNQRWPRHGHKCIRGPSARELFRAIGCDERPDTAAKACPKTSRRERAKSSRAGRQRDRLQDLITEQRLRLGLRVDRELSQTALIAPAKCINGCHRSDVFTDEMIEA